MPTLREFLTSNNIFRGAFTAIDGKGKGYDYWNQLVQFGDDPTIAASGESTILFSGPPVYDHIFTAATAAAAAPAISGDNLKYLVPVGAIQGIQEGGSNNIVPYREVGSKLKRVARGSADYRMTFGRVLTLHSSLAFALYAWLANYEASPDHWMITPGSSAKQLNILDSDLFGLPFGCLLATASGAGELISQEYWEGCYVMDLGKSVGAGQPLIQEQVSLFVTRKVAAGEIVLPTPAGVTLKISG